MNWDLVLQYLALFGGGLALLVLGILALRLTLSFRNLELGQEVVGLRAEVEALKDYQESVVKRWAQRVKRVEKEQDKGAPQGQPVMDGVTLGQVMGGKTPNGTTAPMTVEQARELMAKKSRYR